MTPNPTTKEMSEAEVLAALDVLLPFHSEVADVVAFRSTIESTFAAYANLKRIRSEMETEARQLHADRTALLEVVRRLLPYAKKYALTRTEPRPDVAEAEAVLSRITAPEASR